MQGVGTRRSPGIRNATSAIVTPHPLATTQCSHQPRPQNAEAYPFARTPSPSPCVTAANSHLSSWLCSGLRCCLFRSRPRLHAHASTRGRSSKPRPERLTPSGRCVRHPLPSDAREPSQAKPSQAKRGEVRRGEARRGETRRGEGRRGEGRGARQGQASQARPSPARPSPAQPSPAQPSPAQARPGPAQPGPAQPSPARPSPVNPSATSDALDAAGSAEWASRLAPPLICSASASLATHRCPASTAPASPPASPPPPPASRR